MGAITTSMTFEEFERLPDEPNKLELIDGEVVRMPPAITVHMRIVMALYNILHAAVCSLRGDKACALGEVFAETGYLIGSNWVTPDVSITHAGQQEGKYLEGAPALAIEVISKANTAELMQRKIRLYLENGAKEVWVFFPRTESVMVHRGKTSVQFEGTLTSDLLPGITIDLSEIFAAQKGPQR